MKKNFGAAEIAEGPPRFGEDMPRSARNHRRLPSPLAVATYVGLGTMGAALTLSTGCARDAEAAADAAVEADESAELATALEAARYDPRQSLAPMIKTVGPAVVAIESSRGGNAIRRMIGSGGPALDGRGSGFVVDGSGLVVTNHHVIEGAQNVAVKLSDGRRFEAKVVGSDPATDLAVLRLSGAEDLPVVTLGQSGSLEVGDWVVAMGNPMGLEHSATVGIVSGKGRGSLGLYRDSYLDFLQTDADIAPGSSGGPLFNLRGEVVGINTAVGAGLRPGFAIPVDQAKRIIEQLRDRGEVVRGWLGAGNKPGATGPGAAIGGVYEGTPAARAGLQPGDVVEQLDGEDLESFEALRGRIATKLPGDVVELSVRRNGERVNLSVTLEARPESDALQALRPARPDREATSPKWSSPFRLPFGAEPRGPKGSDPSALRLGVSAKSADGGLEVISVATGSLADTLDLEPGDILKEIDGTSLTSPSDVSGALEAAGPKIELRFLRAGVEHRVTYTR